MAVVKRVSTAYVVEAATGEDDGSAGDSIIELAVANGPDGLVLQIGGGEAAVLRDEDANSLPGLIAKLNRESGRKETVRRPRKK